ncbi:glutaminase A [Salibacterium qingdaonense]|uniref:Glutaminase n=1 Tax=Salibacterium qingdaonense TaxID=266892 RepID=A0A1I4IUK3_9BACI|nr:glutaminase A [Salibacterium qingdaonense]SFL57521.1 L-glutaminase [Salibacterium qingdaonense]
MALFVQKDTLASYMKVVQPEAGKGSVASYIPALQQADPDAFGCAVHQGKEKAEAGDTGIRFTLQSVAKVISLALALMDRGREEVFSRVGMEPSGNPFHSIQALEKEKPAKPLNPMINAGALVVADMLQEKRPDTAADRFVGLIQQITANPDVDICAETAVSERNHSNLNRALCYFLKSHNVLENEVEEVLNTYINLCSVKVNSCDLARIGSVLGADGRDPETGEYLIPSWTAEMVTTFMVTCGMYDASGSFAINAGIPCKSGVSGALLGSLPDGTGIGVYSPPLDSHGNSAAGTRLLERLSSDFQLSIFSGRV